MKRVARRALAIFAILLFSVGAVAPGISAPTGPTAQEYRVKAVFLFNFVQFAEWPAEAFPDAGAPIRIGVLGEDPFGTALEETVKDESIRNRPLVVERAQRVEDLKNCHLVFVSKSERNRLPQILPELENRATLTVGEVEGFARRGGIINFFLDGKKVRFEINASAAQRGGLKLSSQLLSLGKIVSPEPGKEEK